MAIPCKPIADQWEEIKSTFLRLYQDENKSLDEVRQELEERLDFRASRSAFTRQIERWNAFKNYKASDKQLLASQRIRGQNPKVDFQGRPVKWDRVYRATRGPRIHKRRQQCRIDPPGHADWKSVIASAAPSLSHPTDHDGRVVSCVVDIWRHSTVQFASRDPLTVSYNTDYSMYNRLMQSMAFITTCSQLRWPKPEIDMICDAIPALVAEQPAMVCDLLNFLTRWEPPEIFRGFRILRDQLFTYIRSMSHKVLPEASSFRRFTSQLHNREAFTRLGATIAKAKVDTMWNTTVGPAGQTQHDRPFFRQVLINAILMVMAYGELEFASMFLKRLAEYDSEDPFYLAACTRLGDLKDQGERAIVKKDEVLLPTDSLQSSNSDQAGNTQKVLIQGQPAAAIDDAEPPQTQVTVSPPAPTEQAATALGPTVMAEQQSRQP